MFYSKVIFQLSFIVQLFIFISGEYTFSEKCPANEEYSSCKRCESSCIGQIPCTIQYCVRGCQCKPGLVRNQANRCVPKQFCSRYGRHVTRDYRPSLLSDIGFAQKDQFHPGYPQPFNPDQLYPKYPQSSLVPGYPNIPEDTTSFLPGLSTNCHVEPCNGVSNTPSWVPGYPRGQPMQVSEYTKIPEDIPPFMSGYPNEPNYPPRWNLDYPSISQDKSSWASGIPSDIPSWGPGLQNDLSSELKWPTINPTQLGTYHGYKNDEYQTNSRYAA